MIKTIKSYLKTRATRKARKDKIEKREDQSRKQFEYLAKKGLRIPVYTL